ncbi:hypothetical protein CP532_6856 [Ophiocordyceps camponoti-leonardi (nom. inval.)]|nr:hypothetical protein CP532_6856 [Ophiocordyceps camponoti-leonardi (nom. inval.)]
MPAQRTFILLPPTAGYESSKTTDRPMTSRQVRKAHKQKTTTTRSEERIQQQQTRRAEREEAQKEAVRARARVARDKKRARELAEREERRRSGLPLEAPRPSQECIAAAEDDDAQPQPQPPCGTQAILLHPDDFFPSSSQQERELEDEFRPTVPAALPSSTTKLSRLTALSSSPRQRSQYKSPAKASFKPSSITPDKENIAPLTDHLDCPDASQETEYGGGWVDDIVSELLV